MKMTYRKIVVLMAVMVMWQAPSLAAAESEWEFRLTPYLWFAGVDGDVSTLPGQPVSPIKMSASDALKDTETSFMLIAEAKKQKQGVLLDLLYSDVQSDTVLNPVFLLTMRSTSKSTLATGAYEYELYKTDRAAADAFGGLRYWKVDSKLSFGIGPGILGGLNIQNAESWVDPLVGVKGRITLGNSRFYAAGWVAFGGFGVGSDHFYDLSANIGYQWSKAIGTTLGYRMFDVKYKEGTFYYDVTQEGWALGLTWAF